MKNRVFELARSTVAVAMALAFALASCAGSPETRGGIVATGSDFAAHSVKGKGNTLTVNLPATWKRNYTSASAHDVAAFFHPVGTTEREAPAIIAILVSRHDPGDSLSDYVEWDLKNFTDSYAGYAAEKMDPPVECANGYEYEMYELYKDDASSYQHCAYIDFGDGTFGCFYIEVFDRAAGEPLIPDFYEALRSLEAR